MGGRQAAVLLPLVLAAAEPCLAEDTFRAEAGLAFTKMSSDAQREKAVGVDATYYFANLPSAPKDTPYEQVQFVERVGSVSANYAGTSLDLDGYETVGKGSDYGVAIQFARPGMPLLAVARYESSSTGRHTTATGNDFRADSRGYQLSLGAYVARTTTLTLDWAKAETRNRNSNLPDINNTSKLVGLTGQHLGKFPGGGHYAVTVVAAQITQESDDGSPSEKNKEFAVIGTYYPTKTLGLKIGVSVNHGDDQLSEGETYVAGVRNFFTEAFSLSLDYLKFNAKLQGNASDTIMLRAVLRF